MLDASSSVKDLAVSEALCPLEKQRDDLAAELEQAKLERQKALELAAAKSTSELQKADSQKDAEILKLRNKHESAETAKKHELAEAVNAAESERDELKNNLERVMLEKESAEEAG